MINYVVGDATHPQGDGHKLIVYVCNNIGAWGAGFVMALSNRWTRPEEYYRWWHQSAKPDLYKPFELGKVQYVYVDSYFIPGPNSKLWQIHVANMIAQNGVRGPGNVHPLDYEALETCLVDVAKIAKSNSMSVHMPRIGCGLAGGKWEDVERVIQRTLADVSVTVYDLE